MINISNIRVKEWPVKVCLALAIVIFVSTANVSCNESPRLALLSKILVSQQKPDQYLLEGLTSDDESLVQRDSAGTDSESAYRNDLRLQKELSNLRSAYINRDREEQSEESNEEKSAKHIFKRMGPVKKDSKT
jgi:hypothetical protein